MTLQLEESFPRGKDPKPNRAIPLRKSLKSTNVLKTTDDEDLFKISKPSESKKKKKKSSNDLTSEETDLLNYEGGTKKSRDFIIESLTYESLCEGLLTLGRIFKVKEKEILINLPGRMIGSVPITAISKPYTEALEKIVKRGTFTDDEKEQVHLIDQMFKVGQIVIVKVANVDRSKTFARVLLSMNPSDVHKNYNATNLVEGMNLTCAVKSIEDHGYIMESGIKGVNGFLPYSGTKTYVRYENNNKKLGIGQLVYCKITKCDIHRLMAKLQLTIVTKEVANAIVAEDCSLNYSLLLPGMMVHGTVTNIHKTGMKVYFSELSGLIHQDHLNEIWSVPMQSDLASSITPRILYVLPSGIHPYLTLKSGFCPYTFSQKNQEVYNKYQKGDKVKVAITRFEKRGLIVKFPNGEKGIVTLQRCSDDMSLNEEQIAKQYPIESKHECRVMDFNSVDGVYSCSLQKSILDKKFGNVSQVKPGDCVNCKIVKWVPSGAIVNFEKLKAFIPVVHFGDAPLESPQTKYPVNSIVKARVMSNMDSNIKLTAKKKLIKSNGAVLSSYDDVKIGVIGDAMVNRVSKAGLNVYLLGGLSGFVPASKVAKTLIPDLSSVFFVGKVVRCKVLEADAKINRIILTMILDDEANETQNSGGAGKDSSKDTTENEKKRGKKRQQAESQEVPVNKKKQKSKANKDIQVLIVDSTKKIETVTDVIEVDDDVKIEVKEEDVSEGETSTLVSTSTGSKRRKNKKNEKQKEIKGINPLPLPSLELSTSSFWDTPKNDINETPSDESDGEDVGSRKSKKKRLDKNTKEIIRECELKEKEMSLADPERIPESVDDFERMIFASPNSSMVWLAYMAFYLQGVEIDKARSVAKRALSRISYNEDQEKTNIWGALVNLEIDHGTKETLKETFDEACRRCDDFFIYKHTIDSYLNASKIQEAEDLQQIRLKKFANKVEVWKTQADLLFKYLKRPNDAAKLLQRCEQHLSKKDYVDMANHMARLEIKHGKVERGKTMFETTLESFPKRSDIWIMYAKMLIHIKDFDGARTVYNRAIETSMLKKKSLSTIFKDALQFEKEYGNEKTLNVMESVIKEKCNVFATSLTTLIS